MNFLALGRLLRISLAPTALADVAAGIVLTSGKWPAGFAPWALMLASASVYHGGMALNDWADREEDARAARGRPIPSGAIRARTALLLAVGLLVAGPQIAARVTPAAGACLGTVALLAALYDLCGRGPWLGPLLLGACRAANLGTGILFGLEVRRSLGEPEWLAGAVARAALLAAAAYGAYFFAVSRLARLEDAPDEVRERARPAVHARLAASLLLLVGFVRFTPSMGEDLRNPLALLATGISLPLAAAGAWGLFAAARTGPWSSGEVQRVVGMALRRALIATSALACQSGTPDGFVVAAAILCGYPLSHALRRVFPPT